jgi:hypothetical protein
MRTALGPALTWGWHREPSVGRIRVLGPSHTPRSKVGLEWWDPRRGSWAPGRNKAVRRCGWIGPDRAVKSGDGLCTRIEGQVWNARVAMRINRRTMMDSVRSPGRVGCGRGSTGRTLVIVALAGAFADVYSAGPSEPATSTRPALGSILVTQIPFRSSSDDGDATHGGLSGAELPSGSRIVEFNVEGESSRVRSLTDGFAAAGRADLSFEGTHFLFVGRRAASDKNAVWEMRLADGEVRQVVAPPFGCEAAIYLSTLYTLDAEQPVRRIAFCGPASAAEPNQFFTCRTDGSDVQQITFAPEGVSDGYLLTDGRLLFSMGLPANSAAASESPTFNRALFTVNVDGTDIFPFVGVGDGPAWRGRACESPDGWVYFLESKATHPGKAGSVVAVRRTTSLHSRRVVASTDQGDFHSISVLEDGRLLVSYRTGEGRVRSSYDLHILNPNNGELSRPVVDKPTWHEVDPVAVRPRPVPHGRSSVVNSNTTVGQLYCLDVDLSDDAGGSRPGERQVTGVRVFSANARDEVLGTASVESDGSFFLEAPARTPLRLETVDGRGEVVRTMRSWMWLMPMERRGCIGCHEDRELTPPNRHVLALRKAAQRIGVGDPPAIVEPLEGP